jgi:hypothetical protein
MTEDDAFAISMKRRRRSVFGNDGKIIKARSVNQKKLVDD